MIIRLILPLALCTAGWMNVAQAQEEPKRSQYSIKEDDPPTGSAIRRNAVGSFSVPINKRYDELSSEERQALNRSYEHIDEGDEPPFPAEGLKPLLKAIYAIQGKLLVTGKLFLVADVEPDGHVSQVKAEGSPSAEMTKYAGAALMLTKFKPAVCKGRPCKMQFPLEMIFKVRD